MAGGHMKYRALSRSSAHRQALLRNLVTSLIEHESITTTWHKAKEAQRQAEKLITLGKRNTDMSRSRAQAILYKDDLLKKLFGPLRERYEQRQGGYTRVLRIEPEKEDQAQSAILELVDGPKDMRFAMTARTIAKVEQKNQEINDMTAMNIVKVTRYRQGGENKLRDMVEQFKKLDAAGDSGVAEVKKKRVYLEQDPSR